MQNVRAAFLTIIGTAVMVTVVLQTSNLCSAQSVNSSKVKFLLAQCGKSNGSFWRQATGIVARDIDLSEDATAKQILQMGVTFLQETCPSAPTPFGNIEVDLRLGDPASFMDPASFGEIHTGNHSDLVFATSSDSNQISWYNYINEPRKAKEVAEAQAQQLQAQQRQEQAEQKKKSEIASIFKSNSVTRLVTIDQLAANPFVFKGQVVAIRGYFSQMNSETRATFHVGDSFFVVSGVPSSKFTRQGDAFILAARVIGKTSETGLPHLSYVGSAACRDLGCGEYISNFR